MAGALGTDHRAGERRREKESNPLTRKIGPSWLRGLAYGALPLAALGGAGALAAQGYNAERESAMGNPDPIRSHISLDPVAHFGPTGEPIARYDQSGTRGSLDPGVLDRAGLLPRGLAPRIGGHVAGMAGSQARSIQGRNLAEGADELKRDLQEGAGNLWDKVQKEAPGILDQAQEEAPGLWDKAKGLW